VVNGQITTLPAVWIRARHVRIVGAKTRAGIARRGFLTAEATR
jgi:hypothetical protein